MDLKKLSVPQRLAAGLGCVVILALCLGAGLLAFFEYTVSHRINEDLAAAPLHWADSLRAYGRLPGFEDLALARTDSGDGAALAWERAARRPRTGIEHAYRVLTGAEQNAMSSDTAAWRDAETDSTLDDLVRAAGMRDWHALDHALNNSDTLARHNALAIVWPNYTPMRTAGRALVVRGLRRLARGDRAGARGDFAATVSLGRQLFDHEPTLVGLLMGRAIISSGMRGWERYAAATRDTALARRAAAAGALAATRIVKSAELLIAAPDTALALAEDTSIAVGLRVEAMTTALASSLIRPRGFVFGTPGRQRARLRALENDPNRDVARYAVIAGATAERTGLRRVNALLREAQAVR